MPEIKHDEAYMGLKILKLINNIPSVSDIDFLGKYLPTGSTHKHGAMEIYLLAPFIFFGDSTLESLRVGAVLWGILILLLTYYFCVSFFNPAVGLLSIIFLTTNNTFLSLVKIGGYCGFSMPIFTISALLSLFKWGETKKNLYFYIGMFLLGLGFNTQGYFIWFIIAFFISTFSMNSSFNKIKLKTLLSGLVFILLGSIPILYHYFKTHIFNFALQKIFISAHGINNLNIAKNLFVRFKQLNYLFFGGILYHGRLCKNCNFAMIFTGIFFAFCLFYLSYLIFIKRKTLFSKQKILFILSIVLLTFIISAVTFTTHRPGHLFILFPYIQIIMGIAIFEMSKDLGDRFKSWKMIIILLVLMLVIVNTKVSLLEHKDLMKEKVRKSTCNVSILTSWLFKNRIYEPVVFNRLVEFGTEFYSNLEIDTYYLDSKMTFVYLDSSKPFSGRNLVMENEMLHSTSKKVFIFDVDKGLFSDLEEYEAFIQLAKKLNKKIIVRKKFLYSDGKTRYLIVSLK